MAEGRLSTPERLALELAVFMATEVVLSDDLKMMARLAREVVPAVPATSPVQGVAACLDAAARAEGPVDRSSSTWALRMSVAAYFKDRIGLDYERFSEELARSA